MTWETATHFAIWIVALAVALLVVMFCAAGVVALYEGIAERRARTAVRFAHLIEEEKNLRKLQSAEVRRRLRNLEQAVRELNPGINL